MAKTVSEPIPRETLEDTLFLLRAMWPLVMCENPAPFLRLGEQARAWAISLEATRAFGCFYLSCVSFVLATATGWWPLGIASFCFSLAGTRRVRRARALRLRWTCPRVRPLGHVDAFPTPSSTTAEQGA